MTSGASVAVGFSAGALVSFVCTPAAISVARRTGFYDQPRGYRQHSAPTPFLGGAAVLVATLAVAASIGGLTGRLLVPVACATVLWAIGTLDDWTPVAPQWRVAAAVGSAIALSAAGLGWHSGGGDLLDAVLTLLWVVGIVNAFNLMDNMDGACATVGCVSAAGISTLAALHGQPVLAGLSFGLAGSLAGFLPWNLCRPAKIFLGDGGSMLVGFLIASLTMAAADHVPGGDGRLLLGCLLVALPILDTALVIVSRSRRHVRVVTGGRDHLTHRLLLALRRPQTVAAVLALVQAAICVVAILGEDIGTAFLASFSACAIAAGVIAIALLDSPRWRPDGIALGTSDRRVGRRDASISLD